jgi:hypothetical protein
MQKSISYKLISILLALGLTACGGSDGDDPVYTDAYLQFYNGSANSALTTMGEVDESALGSASYGDATTLLNLSSGELDLEFFRTDADDKEILLDEMSIKLQDGQKSIIILSGDYESPSFVEHSFTREDLSDHFRLFATSVIADQSNYDLYMSEAGAPFSAANLLGTINYQGFDEMPYWAADSVSDDFDKGEYVFYLTLPGQSEPLFETPTINFVYDTEYVLVLRNTTGAIKNNIEIDLIINSTTVANYADADASSQYRIYNSLDNSGSIHLTLDGNGEDASESLDIADNSMSEFNSITFGDYRLSAQSADESGLGFNNRLLTLNQGQSKAIILYQDSDNKLTSLSLKESTLPQVFDHQVSAVNLSPDFSDIDLYFVRKDETIETAEYRISSLDFAETKTLTLPSDYYELIAVYDDDNDTQVLLDRTELIGINQEYNYILTIEKTALSPTGYQINLLH